MPDFNIHTPAEADLEISEKRQLGMIMVTIILITLIDVLFDFFQGIGLIHLCIELFIIPLASIGLLKVWGGYNKLDKENIGLKSTLAKIEISASEWKKDAEKYLRGLSGAIDVQLERWNLSAAEKEVALLLLKGLSHKEIAIIRNTSERTARQQSQALYEKSGLSGRADLAAFFLEDLLTPNL